MHAFVGSCHDTDVQLLVLAELLVERRGEGERQRVVVLGLDVVHSVLSLRRGTAVGIVQLVPVDLAVGLRRRPVFIRAIPVGQGLRGAVGRVVGVPHVVIAAGHVLPVAGMGVARVVIIQLCALVHGVLAEERGSQLGVVGYVPVPCEQHRWRIVVHHARVALLAVLVSPVGVVEAVVGQPVHLVGAGALRCALGGIAPGDERERVCPVAEHLLHAEEVRKRVVERALDVAFVGPAVSDVAREGPALVAKTRVEGVHAAQHVVAVGAAEGYPVARRHGGRTEVVVV